MNADHMIFLFFGAVAITSMLIIIVQAKRSAENVLETNLTHNKGYLNNKHIQHHEYKKPDERLYNKTEFWINKTKSELEAALKKAKDEDCKKSIEMASYHFSKLSESLQNSLQHAYPADLLQHGLFYACRELCETINKTGIVEISHYFNHVIINEQKELLLYVYKLFNEVLNNLIKYSYTQKIFVSGQKNRNEIKIIIRYMGSEFNPLHVNNSSNYPCIENINTNNKWLHAQTHYTHNNNENLIEIFFDKKALNEN